MGLSGCGCFLISRRLRHRRSRRRFVISLVDVGQVDAVRGRGLDVSPGALLEDIRHVDLRGLEDDSLELIRGAFVMQLWPSISYTWL